MARKGKAIIINLQKLHWDEVVVATGGGSGPDTPTVTPYMWIVFFKADGLTLQLTESLKLSGSVTTFTTPGSHGNLLSSIEVGHSIDIPSDIGWWTSALQPIPVAAAVQGLVGSPDLPAFFGAVAVLMVEGGHIPEHAAEAGAQRLADGG